MILKKNDLNRSIIYKLFFSILIGINLKTFICRNSSTCYEMYINNTIHEKCFNSTACCYIEYDFYDNFFKKCIEKKNNTDKNICSKIKEVSSLNSANINICDCFQVYIKFNFKIFLLLILFIF